MSPPDASRSPSTWSICPLLPGPWRTLSLGDACAVIARFTAHEAREDDSEPTASRVAFQQVRVLPLCALPGWLLAEMEAVLDDGNSGFIALLMGPGGRLLPVDWSNGPLICAATGSLPWPPNDAQAREFIRLFCNLISGSGHRFHLVESLDEVDLPAGLTAKTRTAFGKMLRPLTLTHIKGEVHAEATMIYAGQVSHVRLQMLPTGIIEMADDTPLGAAHIKDEELRGLLRIVHANAFVPS